MSTSLQPHAPSQGVKRDVYGQPKAQSQDNFDISPQIRQALERIPTPQLLSVFEPAIKEHLKHRLPGGDIERMLENVKTNTSREKIMKIAGLFPLVMAELKESNYHRPSVGLHTEAGQTQHRDTQMELLPHTSPPPPYEVHLVPNVTILPALALTSASNVVNTEQTRPLIPPREPTVLRGFYLAGIGKHKTSEKQFNISEVNYVRALAWARRTLAFDGSNEHLMYHFKAVLSSDVEVLYNTLKALNIVESTNSSMDVASASDNTDRQEAFKNAKLQCDQIVAQSIYKLPTVWPSSTDFLIDLNQENSRELFPQGESDPYIDVTDLISNGSNVYTMVEFKDMRKYTFCLFEKHPTKEEIEEATRL